VEDEVISKNLTDNEGNYIIYANASIPVGLHSGKIMFEGDDEYSEASRSFSILAYRGVNFSVTRDAYRFGNWPFTPEEYQQMKDYIQSNVKPPLNYIAGIVLPPLFQFYAGRGHCFGMASTSSSYFVNPSLKPKNVETYLLSKDDQTILKINLYHLLQAIYAFPIKVKFYPKGPIVSRSDYLLNVHEALPKIKKAIDEGAPPILAYTIRLEKEIDGIKEIAHAVTVIGYVDTPDETYLVLYDNDFPNTTAIVKVSDGAILIGGHKITVVKVVDIRDFIKVVTLPNLPARIIEALSQLFNFLAVHSDVDVTIKSSDGGEIKLVDDEITKNSIEHSYAYVSSDLKVFALPSGKNYSVTVTGRKSEEISLDIIYCTKGKLILNQLKNVTISPRTKLYLQSLKNNQAKIDYDNDGNTDQTLTLNEETIDITQAEGKQAETPEPETPEILKRVAIASITTIIVVSVVIILKKTRQKARKEKRLMHSIDLPLPWIMSTYFYGGSKLADNLFIHLEDFYPLL